MQVYTYSHGVKNLNYNTHALFYAFIQFTVVYQMDLRLITPKVPLKWFYHKCNFIYQTVHFVCLISFSFLQSLGAVCCTTFSVVLAGLQSLIPFHLTVIEILTKNSLVAPTAVHVTL